jgi:phospholipase D-like protein
VEWLIVLLFVVFFLLSLAGLAVWIWALIDCLQVPDDALYESGNKLVWVLIIVFLNVIGAILYVAIGRPQGTRTGAATGNGDGRMPPPPPPDTVT